MPKGQKHIVIAHLFKQRYNADTRTLSNSVVTAAELQAAKRYCNEHLGANIKLDSNPFNFMKDLVRGKNAAKNWPQSVRDLGYVGEQLTGDSRVFEFVPVREGEVEAFEVDFRPSDETPCYPVQSLSLPLASKELGRTDESWLLQVAVNLRILETHFAIGENKQIEALELNHLQMDIKLRRVQIDALFRAKCLATSKDAPDSALITVEAKQGKQRILVEQIARQVKATFDSTDTNLVIPTALAAVNGKGIYVVEFKAVKRVDIEKFTEPTFHRDALCELLPSVKGV